MASGKSTVAALLAQAGVARLDADAHARAVVGRPEVLAALVERFGEGILDPGQGLDRAALAKAAFADSEATAALNAIVHPAVRRALMADLEAAGDGAVVLDVPLLLESPLAELVDSWVFIATDEGDRETRATARGWEAGERARRESHQADLSTKRQRAEHVLENRGTMEDLGAQVQALLTTLGLSGGQSSPPTTKS